MWNNPDTQNNDWLSKMMGGAGIGSGLYGLFGNNKNPADEANKYINQIPGKTNPYFDPYFQAGKDQIPGLQDQYNQGMTDPGGKLNEIGGAYKQSPGLQFAIQQALMGGNNAAAAGGMAGSPQHQQQNMGLATNLASQDYNDWLKQATGLYGNAMTGSQGMANQGQQAGQSQADMIAQALAQKAAYGYEGQAQKNQNWSNAFGNIGGGLAAFFGL